MIVAVLADHILDAVGVVYIINLTIKIARGYPVSRWFF
jgi:hypothetical protein